MGISAGKVNVTAPIKLVNSNAVSSAAKNALNAIRNGPIKASLSAGGFQGKIPAKVTTQAQQQRNNASDTQNSTKQQKASVQPKKQRPATAQHNRPSSPGIHGKVAEAPYKSYANTIKSNACHNT